MCSHSTNSTITGKAIPKHTSGIWTPSDSACICRAWSRYCCICGTLKQRSVLGESERQAQVLVRASGQPHEPVGAQQRALNLGGVERAARRADALGEIGDLVE